MRILFFILLCLNLNAAPRYLVSGGTGNWNSTSNWSATDGGASGASFPTSADDVFMTATSGSAGITTNVSSAAKTITISNGWTGTLTMTNTLTVSGNVSLGTSFTQAGSAALIVNAAATITSNGVTWASALTLGTATVTISLADNWTVTGLVTLGASTTSPIINGNTLSCNGSVLIAGTATTRIISGTTTIKMGGTGTLSSNGGVLRNNLTFNSSGTITLSGTIPYNTGTITYTAGTISAGTSIISCSTSTTFSLNGATFANLTITTPDTYTFSNNLTLSGDLSYTSNSSSTLTLTGSTINIGGNLSLSNITNGVVSGTTVLNMNGTGTISMPSVTTGGLSNNITTAGTIVASGVRYRSGTWTHSSGTLTGSIYFTTTAPTFTVNSTGVSLTLLDIAVSTTINGTQGLSTTTLSCTTAGSVITLAASKTYTVGTLTLWGTLVSPVQILSSIGGTRAIVTVSSNDVLYTTATDIDSSSGITVWNFKGTNSNNLNWNLLTPPGNITTSF